MIDAREERPTVEPATEHPARPSSSGLRVRVAGESRPPLLPAVDQHRPTTEEELFRAYRVDLDDERAR